MIIGEIGNIKAGKREIKQFAITLGIILVVLGGLSLWRGKEWFFCLFIILAMLFLFGLIQPLLLKPVYKLWMVVARITGWFMTRIILGILFYLVVTPISLIARLAGKDFLDEKLDKNATSYWIPTPLKKRSYENQF